MKFRFDIKELSSEFPELAKFDGQHGTIDSIEIGDGETDFEDCYWNVTMDDGTRLSGISGYHLETHSKEIVRYPNGQIVDESSVDLDVALDYMYGTDRESDNSKYSVAKKQRAINYWIEKTDGTIQM